jgi:hypothetical protein
VRHTSIEGIPSRSRQGALFCSFQPHGVDAAGKRHEICRESRNVSHIFKSMGFDERNIAARPPRRGTDWWKKRKLGLAEPPYTKDHNMWSLGSDSFLQMITRQHPGSTGLPRVPLWCAWSSIEKLALTSRKDGQTGQCAARTSQDAVKILQEPKSLSLDQRSLHGLAAVR